MEMTRETQQHSQVLSVGPFLSITLILGFEFFPNEAHSANSKEGIPQRQIQDRLQDLNWISHCAHSHLGSPTHPWAHTSPPGLTHSHLGSYPGSLTHTQNYLLTHGLTPGLTHSHPCLPTHTWAHSFTPGLIHLHLGSPIHTHGHPLTPVLIRSHLGSSAHTWAHFYSKVIGQCIKHEIQVRVLLCTMPGPLANPVYGVCTHIGFFHCLPQVASGWGPSPSQAKHAPHVLSDKQPSGTVCIKSRWELEL